LKQSDSSPSRGGGAARKKWGEPAAVSGKPPIQTGPTKAIHEISSKPNEEETYSDSFEEI
jgi:hypothetical protein